VHRVLTVAGRYDLDMVCAACSERHKGVTRWAVDRQQGRTVLTKSYRCEACGKEHAVERVRSRDGQL